MTQHAFHIKASCIKKNFMLQRGPRVALNMLLSAAKKRANVFPALRGIDLTAKKGEIIGIIGKNGSGKSTFLRILAGILQEDGGTIELHGRVLYLSGLSFSTDPYLTVRENIYLICTVLGLRRKEIKGKISGILEFAGLQEFLDVEVFKLSSGMIVRLNTAVIFACMEHIRPNVFLMDEVLSVGGDIEFQNKSLAKIENILATGATIVMTSHDLSFVERFCHRTLWFENGSVRREGAPSEIVREYMSGYI